MATPKSRPSVPGTRKREGAKNLPVEKDTSSLSSIATWNVRTLNVDGKLEQVVMEMERFNLKILGLAETHWNKDVEEAFEKSNYVVIHSARKDTTCRQGVGFIIDKTVFQQLTHYECHSERIISATFKFDTQEFTFIQVYAPDSTYNESAIEDFYNQLQSIVNNTNKKANIILMGDFNAKVGGNSHENWPEVVGKYGLGTSNERGNNLLQFCSINNLVITNTIFRHKNKRRATWLSPDGATFNQIDYIIVKDSLRTKITNSRAFHSADVYTDHFLVIANLTISTGQPLRKKPSHTKRFDVDKLLNDPALTRRFELCLKNRFSELSDSEQNDIDTLYCSFKDTVNMTTQEIAGISKRKHVHGLDSQTIKLCDERRSARKELMIKPNNYQLRAQYNDLNKQVKKSVRSKKKANLEQLVESMEDYFRRNNTHNLF